MPSWVERVGGPNEPIVDVFNEKVGPIVGVKINPDGSVVEAPVTMPLDSFKDPQYAN